MFNYPHLKTHAKFRVKSAAYFGHMVIQVKSRFMVMPRFFTLSENEIGFALMKIKGTSCDGSCEVPVTIACDFVELMDNELAFEF
jgi:hypothetical protein